MSTTNPSPVPPSTPNSGPSSGRASPWSAQAEVELRQQAEKRATYWQKQCRDKDEEIRVLRAAADDRAGRVHLMARDSSQFGEEVQVLREKFKRYDKRNWTELALAVLKGPRSGEQLDYTMDVRDCVAFRAALKEIHRQRDEESREWLQDHAFRAEKQLLGKMAHRKSNRRMFWENSLYKFDHSARDKDGQRVRKREMMAKDSVVRAPELYNPKATLALIREDEKDEATPAAATPAAR